MDFYDHKMETEGSRTDSKNETPTENSQAVWDDYTGYPTRMKPFPEKTLGSVWKLGIPRISQIEANIK